MFLCSLEIKNYRSLEHVKLDNLQQFNVLIGRNNAGKSSVFQALYDLNNANKSDKIANPIKRSRKYTEVDKSNIGISPHVITDYDNKRSLEIFLEFKPSPQERQRFIKLLVADSLDETRQGDILNSPFLRKIRYSLKAAPGKPSPMYVREVSTLTEDGKWEIIVEEVKDDQKTVLDQNSISVYEIEDISRNFLKSSFSEKERRLVHTSNLTLSNAWAFDSQIDWLLRQPIKYRCHTDCCVTGSGYRDLPTR